MTYEHFSGQLFELEERELGAQRVHHKPRGFWFSVKGGGHEWPDFCIGEDFYPESLKYRYIVTLKEDANILRLGTVAEILRFHEKYKKLIAPNSGIEYIDWAAVAADYDGIVISPYQWSLRMNMELFWYYSWDVASGCVWSHKAIESVKLGKKRNLT